MLKSILVATLFINFFCHINIFAEYNNDSLSIEESGGPKNPSKIVKVKNICGCSVAIVAVITGATVAVSVVVGGVVLCVRSFDDIQDFLDCLNIFESFDSSQYGNWNASAFWEWLKSLF